MKSGFQNFNQTQDSVGHLTVIDVQNSKKKFRSNDLAWSAGVTTIAVKRPVKF